MITDARALNAFAVLCRKEGILPALESSHALAWVLDNSALLPQGGQIVVTLSGRGDKDMGIVRRHLPELCEKDALS
jgi:tryptophan synthase beta chain